MIWAERHDLELAVIEAGADLTIVIDANRATLTAAEARRLAAALLNAADQIDGCGQPPDDDDS